MLVVEDEFMVSMLIEDFLRDCGCGRVTSVTSTAAALATVNDAPPDIALLDVMLGHDTSFEIAALLQSLQVPFVFLTALGDGGMPAEWRKHPRLEKPFALDQLSEAVTALLAAQSG